MGRASLLKLVIAGVFLVGSFFAALGIWLVYLSSTGDSEIRFFGQTIKTANAGVAAIFFGSVTIVLIVRQALTIIGKMPDAAEDKISTTTIIAAMLHDQNVKIAELEGRLRQMETAATQLKAELFVAQRLSSPKRSELYTGLVPAIQAFSESEYPDDLDVHRIMENKSLTVNDKIMLMSTRIMGRIDQDIIQQSRHLEEIRGSVGEPTLDVESMKLKRLIDKRTQMFNTLREVTDKYNQTAKGIIDAMGR
jgi:hypothetical protein